MPQAHPLLVLLVALLLSMSLGARAEDVPQTAYDESESLPYESTSVLSTAALELVAQAPAVWSCALWGPCDCIRCRNAEAAFATGLCDLESDFTIFDYSLRC